MDIQNFHKKYLSLLLSVLILVVLILQCFTAVAANKSQIRLSDPKNVQVQRFSQKKVTLSDSGNSKFFIKLREPDTHLVAKGHASRLDSIAAQQNSVLATIATRLPEVSLVQQFQRYQNLMVVAASQQDLDEIKSMKEVVAVYPSVPLRISVENAKSQIGLTTLIEEVGVDNVSGEGVKVAVIDTGIDYRHPDLGGCFGSGCKVIGGYDFVNEEIDPIDDNDHGTHVAGIIAADGVVQGVAPKASLYALKSCGSFGWCQDFHVLRAIEWAMDPNGDGDTEDAADIINLSLGSPFGEPDSPLSVAVDLAVQSGIVTVVSAGNGYLDFSIGAPANAALALTVGAMDGEGGVAPFSSKGFILQNNSLKPEIAAPGVSISSTIRDNEYQEFSGTSMAAPMVAGVAAIIKQNFSSLTAQEIKGKIISSAQFQGNRLTEEGNGIVDVQKAYNSVLIPEPSILEFGWIEDFEEQSKSLELALHNPGVDDVLVTLSIENNDDSPLNYHLSKEQLSVPAGELKTVTITAELMVELNTLTNTFEAARLNISGVQELSVPLFITTQSKLNVALTELDSHYNYVAAISKSSGRASYSYPHREDSAIELTLFDRGEHVLKSSWLDVNNEVPGNVTNTALQMGVVPNVTEDLVVGNSDELMPVTMFLPDHMGNNLTAKNQVRKGKQLDTKVVYQEYLDSSISISGYVPSTWKTSNPDENFRYQTYLYNYNDNTFDNTGRLALSLPGDVVQTKEENGDVQLRIEHASENVKTLRTFLNNKVGDSGFHVYWQQFFADFATGFGVGYAMEDENVVHQTLLLEFDNKEHLYVFDAVHYTTDLNRLISTAEFYLTSRGLVLTNAMSTSNQLQLIAADSAYIDLKLGFLQPYFKGRLIKQDESFAISYDAANSRAFFTDNYLSYSDALIDIEADVDLSIDQILNHARFIDSDDFYRPDVIELNSNTANLSLKFSGFELEGKTVDTFAELTFDLSQEDFSPPVIARFAIKTNGSEHAYLANGTGTVAVEVSDDQEVAEMSLYYRQFGEEEWQFASFEWYGNQLNASFDSLEDGLYDLRFIAKDVSGNSIQQTITPAFLAEQGCRFDEDCDGTWNVFESDSDADGVENFLDHFPYDASEWSDNDGDGIGDNADPDDDNDGFTDDQDAFPYDENENQDTDGDGIGNNADQDDDNDGVADNEDCAPLNDSFAQYCAPIRMDFDGDGIADLAFQSIEQGYPRHNIMYSNNRTTGVISISSRPQEGLNLIPLIGDFDGDALMDTKSFGFNNATWIINYTNGGAKFFNTIEARTYQIPVPADYDGDGIADHALRFPETFEWMIIYSSTGLTEWFTFGRHKHDIPVPADYDGDGKADLAVRRPSDQTWYIKNSSGLNYNSQRKDGIQRIRFGLQTDDIPVPADYDGDGKADLAVRRPSTLSWYIKNSSGSNFNSARKDGIQRILFGRQATDIPVPADYDGDGKADVAVYRKSTGLWYILNSSGTHYNSGRDDNIQRIRFSRTPDDLPTAAPVVIKMSEMGLVPFPD